MLPNDKDMYIKKFEGFGDKGCGANLPTIRSFLNK